jgi:hypothetical protein
MYEIFNTLVFHHQRRALAFLLLLLASGFVVCVEAGAQSASPAKRNPQSAPTPSQRRQPSNSNKSLTPLRNAETSKGSRLSLRADQSLNDYSAYRSGDRFYIVIPKANASSVESGLQRGRGFDNVQVERRGQDVVVSFRLQPGATARVSQKFNRLDVDVNAPKTSERTAENTATTTQQADNANRREEADAEANRNAEAATAAPGAENENSNSALAEQQSENSAETATQTPTQIAPAPTTQPAPIVAPSTEPAPNESFATALANNWLLILLGAVILLTCLGLIFAARSKSTHTRVAASSPAMVTGEARARNVHEAQTQTKEASHAFEAIPETEMKETIEQREEIGVEEAAFLQWQDSIQPERFHAPVSPAVEAASPLEAEEKAMEATTSLPAPKQEALEQIEDEKDAAQALALSAAAVATSSSERAPMVAEVDSLSRRLESDEAEVRAAALAELARSGSDDEDSFRQINAAFDDPSQEVRNAAAYALFNFKEDKTESFTRALKEATTERKHNIGAAIASSGLAQKAISQLSDAATEKTLEAFSLLFLMLKAGEVEPLLRAIEEHPNNEVRLAVVKLLALSEQQELLPALHRLTTQKSLPAVVRSAVMESIYRINSRA